MGLKLRITLIYTFKALNFIMSVVGAMMCVYTLWMYHQWELVLAESPSSSTLTENLSTESLVKEDTLSRSLMGNLIRVTASNSDSKLSTSWDINLELPATWYVYTFGFVGIFLFVFGVFGSIIAEFPARRILSIYMGSMLAFICFEVSVALFVWVIGTSNLPYDGTGQLAITEEFISDYPATSRIAITFVFIIQVAACVVSYGLRYFATHLISIVREDEMRLHAPLLPPNPEFAPQVISQY